MESSSPDALAWPHGRCQPEPCLGSGRDMRSVRFRLAFRIDGCTCEAVPEMTLSLCHEPWCVISRDRPIGFGLPHFMQDDTEHKKDAAWANVCRENGWLCRICGAVPEQGLQFADNLCDDCRKIVRNE